MKTQITESEVAEAMDWPIEQVRSYVAAGVADGYFESTPLGLRFDPRLPAFLRWYIARLDDALAYKLDPSDLSRMAKRKREELRKDVPDEGLLDAIRRALAAAR